MSTVDAIRSASVNLWSNDFLKKEKAESNLIQSSLFALPEKKFKNTLVSSALSSSEAGNGTQQKGKNPEAKQTPQKQDLDLESIRFFKFGNLY